MTDIKGSLTVKALLPSLDEFQGPYNVTPDDLTALGVPSSPEGCFRLDPGTELAPLTLDEFQEVQGATRQLLREYTGVRRDVPRPTSAFFVIDNYWDRTIRVEVLDWDFLTRDVLDRIQKEVLRSRGAWRVLLMGSTLETGVLVYPDAIRLSAGLEAGGIVAGLRQIRDMERRRMLAQSTPIAFQWEQIRDRLAKAMSGHESVRVLQEFDYPSIGESYVWVLWRGPWWQVPFPPDEVSMRGEEYYLAEDAQVLEESSDKCIAVLTQWIYPIGQVPKMMILEQPNTHRTWHMETNSAECVEIPSPSQTGNGE